MRSPRLDPTFSAIWRLTRSRHRARARARSLNGSFEFLGNERFGSLAAAAINQGISDTIASSPSGLARRTKPSARADRADLPREMFRNGGTRETRVTVFTLAAIGGMRRCGARLHHATSARKAAMMRKEGNSFRELFRVARNRWTRIARYRHVFRTKFGLGFLSNVDREMEDRA